MTTDARPWLCFMSPKHGIRVKKRNVIELGQGRRNERYVGKLPAELSAKDAKTLAREKWGSMKDTRPWFGYWSPAKGPRARRSIIPADERRLGEIEAGTFAADMEEEDVLGMIKAKFGQARHERNNHRRRVRR